MEKMFRFHFHKWIDFYCYFYSIYNVGGEFEGQGRILVQQCLICKKERKKVI